MNAKLFVLLVLLTAGAAAGVYWLVLAPAAQQAASDAGARPLLPELTERADEVARIEIVNESGRITLERVDGVWTLPSKGGYPALVDSIRELTFTLAAMEKLDAKTANEAYHERLGLTMPEPVSDVPATPTFGTPAPTRVIISDVDGGAIADVIVGNSSFRGSDSFTFVRLAGESQTWETKGRVEAPINAGSWFDRSAVKVERADVEQVDVVPAEGEPYVIVREGEGDGFTLQAMPVGRELDPPSAANQVAGSLAFLTIEDVRPAADLDENLFGDAAEFRRRDGAAIRVRRAMVDGDNWLRFEVSGEGGEEMAAKVDGWAFKVAEFAAGSIFKALDDILTDPPPMPEIPEALQPAGPAALDVEQPAEAEPTEQPSEEPKGDAEPTSEDDSDAEAASMPEEPPSGGDE